MKLLTFLDSLSKQIPHTISSSLSIDSQFCVSFIDSLDMFILYWMQTIIAHARAELRYNSFMREFDDDTPKFRANDHNVILFEWSIYQKKAQYIDSCFLRRERFQIQYSGLWVFIRETYSVDISMALCTNSFKGTVRDRLGPQLGVPSGWDDHL